MAIPDDVKKWMARHRRIKKRMAKIRIGLPKEVRFIYNIGTVTCYPKERKWVCEVSGKKPVVHIIAADQRLDVTKYKARRYLKLAAIGMLRDDSKTT